MKKYEDWGYYESNKFEEEVKYMVFYYRNSILASIVSVMGCAFVIVSIPEISWGWPFTIFGLALCFLGKKISQNKAFKTWWDTVIGTGMVARMRTEQEVCVEVYNENPGKQTLKKIREINPEAAGWIEQHIPKK